MWHKLLFIFIALFIIEACGTSSYSVIEKRKYRKGWFIHHKGSMSTASTPKEEQRIKSEKENNHSQLTYSTAKTKGIESSLNKREKEQNITGNNSQEGTNEVTTKSSKKDQNKDAELAVHKPKTNPLLVKIKDLEKTSLKKNEDDSILSSNWSLGCLSLLSLVVALPFLFRTIKPTDEDEKEQSSKYIHNVWVRIFGIIGLSLLLFALMILFLIGIVGISWGGVSTNVILLTIAVLILAYIAVMAYIYVILKLTRREGDDRRIFSRRTYKKFAVIFGGVVVLLSIILTVAFLTGQL